MDDTEFVRRAREGDRSAFDVLVRRYQNLAVMLAHGVLCNFDLAKDASQNAFTKAYFGLKSFRENSQFKTWFFRIVLNEAKDVLRRERSKGFLRFQNASALTPEGEEKQSILELIPASGASPREVFEKRENKRRLEEAIRSLPEKESQVFMLRYFHDLSLAEVSEIMGIAVGTVKAHLSHGTEKLRVALTAPVPAEVQKGGGYNVPR